MNINSAFNLQIKRNLIILISDLMAVAVILFLPAVSHLAPFPVYYLDPMRWVLFAVFFVNRDHFNAYLLAIGLPIFSMLYSGHPVFYKAILISLELFTNMFLLNLFIRPKNNIFFSVFISILASKIVYYLFKFTFIKWSLISGKLISTSLTIQLVIALGLSLVFFLFAGKIHQQSNK
ncbi:MAG: hypothetical protein KDC56_02315 [Flavobacteriaceae bacterium]|nr:hypothetical protein [Flavobacteriaceae bacterium]